ncbi:IS3 family transposase [Caldibacillus debilis]
MKGISFAHKYFTHTEEYIRFYNEERIQIKLNKLTPVEYRRQLA